MYFVIKLMNFVIELMDLVLKLMDFVLKMIAPLGYAPLAPSRLQHKQRKIYQSPACIHKADRICSKYWNQDLDGA